MAVVYFDSSAFVKLVVEQDGTDLAAALWDVCDAAVSSRLAYPEVRAALATAARVGRVKDAHQESLLGQAGEIEPVYERYAVTCVDDASGLVDPVTHAIVTPPGPPESFEGAAPSAGTSPLG